ncbi:hypothetical protein CCP2SC5_460014 [Azospirillaceae bacterium]
MSKPWHRELPIQKQRETLFKPIVCSPENAIRSSLKSSNKLRGGAKVSSNDEDKKLPTTTLLTTTPLALFILIMTILPKNAPPTPHMRHMRLFARAVRGVSY